MRPVSELEGSHDLRLPAWGPYTTRYIGISHVPSVESGLRFDLAVFPGLHRRTLQIPSVKKESGYHPWEATPDLSFYRHRHQIVWKDQVYGDVDFCRIDDESTLICCTCVNATSEAQNVVLHYFASLEIPPLRPNSGQFIAPAAVELPPGAQWIDAVGYDSFDSSAWDPKGTLTPDGCIRGTVRDHGFVDGEGLAFGRAGSAQATYHFEIPGKINQASLVIRYRLPEDETATLKLSGAVSAKLTLHGDGQFAVARVDAGAMVAGEHHLHFAVSSPNGLQLDGFAVCSKDQADHVSFADRPWNRVPRRTQGPTENSLMLKYDDIDTTYGLAWGGASFETREFFCDDLEDSSMAMLLYATGTHLRNRIVRGQGTHHFTNAFVRPIKLEPHSEVRLFGMVCNGTVEEVMERLRDFDPNDARWARHHQQMHSQVPTLKANTEGEVHRFSQERMAATLLTNVIYPVRIRGTWIRHYTPGRYWETLYTWDSGFIGLGLLEIDLDRAIENLNAYLTPPGDPQAAFIHHGSPVPTQFYQFWELYNRTHSPELLEYFYPRLRQYHQFMAGRLGSSTTARLDSGLLQTWDYFYNTGWDDYPPQVYMHQRKMGPATATMSITAHTIRTARMLKTMAEHLGLDAAEYEADIERLTQAIQNHAWDEESGYFGYVLHDSAGKPTGMLRHESGANFNMGLDGVAPLLADICTPEQEQRLVAHLQSAEHLWSACGLSTVDRSAPYFRDDGYWNGSVWMPHQWFYWKTLLDLGEGGVAHRIASTALDVWTREVEASYHCFEHFNVQTQRGCGWHQFGGLSSPVLAWYGAYHRPGRVTGGFNLHVRRLSVGAQMQSVSADLSFIGQPRHKPVVIVTLHPQKSYEVTWNGQRLPYNERYAGTLEVTLPAGITKGTLDVNGHSVQLHG